jgi:hypothetical protein
MFSSDQTSLTLVSDSKSSSTKWHLEWDGTGYCRIVNKATGKAIASVNPNSQITQAVSAATDEQRWQIIPQ